MNYYRIKSNLGWLRINPGDGTVKWVIHKDDGLVLTDPDNIKSVYDFVALQYPDNNIDMIIWEN